MTDPLLANSPGVRDALVELGGVRALLQVPLLKDGAVVGFIGIWRRNRACVPRQAVGSAGGAGGAGGDRVENARLRRVARGWNANYTAEVLQVINASPGNLAPVFDAILEATVCF
jgi:hypothetical protein